ncbi:hypothetical protein PR048_012225 [Dryococelus australis]|uniref:Uncharacterized protein n=1 Tax=Dryococelus australis TaxID=614101 RepID=A0ABQ9HNR1_9NEOP|nr:hypothetical protein PR048_012225 [Dryococelus australis]
MSQTCRGESVPRPGTQRHKALLTLTYGMTESKAYADVKVVHEHCTATFCGRQPCPKTPIPSGKGVAAAATQCDTLEGQSPQPRGHGYPVVRQLAFHLGEPGSIPGGAAPEFLYVGETCQMMPLVGGFSRGSPIFPALAFRRCSIPRSTLIGSQNLDVKVAAWLKEFCTYVA